MGNKTKKLTDVDHQVAWDIRENITSYFGNTCFISGTPIYSEKGLTLCHDLAQGSYKHKEFNDYCANMTEKGVRITKIWVDGCTTDAADLVKALVEQVVCGSYRDEA